MTNDELAERERLLQNISNLEAKTNDSRDSTDEWTDLDELRERVHLLTTIKQAS